MQKTKSTQGKQFQIIEPPSQSYGDSTHAVLSLIAGYGDAFRQVSIAVDPYGGVSLTRVDTGWTGDEAHPGKRGQVDVISMNQEEMEALITAYQHIMAEHQARKELADAKRGEDIPF